MSVNKNNMLKLTPGGVTFKSGSNLKDYNFPETQMANAEFLQLL